MTGSDTRLATFATGGAFFESPRWRNGRLWVCDFWARQVVAISPGGVTRTVAEVAGSPSGFGWAPDGVLLVASLMDRKLLRVNGGKIVQHADLSQHSGPQCNDVVVDACGRAYVGTIDFTSFTDRPTTPLLRVDPDGSVTIAAADLSFPNGMVLSPDGTLVVAESWAGRLTAFDVQPDGSLAHRRVWADLGPECAPDGITLDAEGAIWMADAAGKRVSRVQEGGTILQEIPAGDLDVIACTLGGDDGRTLFVCANLGPRHHAGRGSLHPAHGRPQLPSRHPARGTALRWCMARQCAMHPRVPIGTPPPRPPRSCATGSCRGASRQIRTRARDGRAHPGHRGW
jgi:sugar lactone lactonase YvrE